MSRREEAGGRGKEKAAAPPGACSPAETAGLSLRFCLLFSATPLVNLRAQSTAAMNGVAVSPHPHQRLVVSVLHILF